MKDLTITIPKTVEVEVVGVETKEYENYPTRYWLRVDIKDADVKAILYDGFQRNWGGGNQRKASKYCIRDSEYSDFIVDGKFKVGMKTTKPDVEVGGIVTLKDCRLTNKLSGSRFMRYISYFLTATI